MYVDPTRPTTVIEQLPLAAQKAFQRALFSRLQLHGERRDLSEQLVPENSISDRASIT